MKKIILIPVLIVVFLLNHQTGYTQSENCEPKEMNTNPDITPTQVHLDNIPQDGGSHDPRFLNNFYWWTDPSNIATIPLEDMGLTSGDYYGDMQPINSQFFINHYMYLNHLHREVMRSENGWEILSMNTGVYPDNNTLVNMNINAPLRPIPYLLFYNKYTGVARIFVRYGENSDPTTSINAAEIHIQYQDPENVSGILRNGEGIDQPLDIPTEVQIVTSRVPSPGDESLWFSTDFQLAYDPCVCEYESEFNIYFKFFHTAEIKVAGFFQSATQDLSPEDLYNGNSYNQTYLNAMMNEMDKAGEGYVIYKHMNDLIDDYLERLSVYKQNVATAQSFNSSIKKQQSIMKIAKLIFSLASGVALPTISGDAEYQNNVDNVDELKNQPDKDDFGPETQKAYFKEFNKAMSTGFDLLISSSLNAKTLPSTPKMPTASFGEMKFSGTLSDEAKTSGPTIKTPGSLNSNIVDAQLPTQFPIYNESVGVFALLNSPELVISNKKNENCYVYGTQNMTITSQGTTDSQDIELKKIESERITQFKLKNDLEYYFNPALDIKEYSIDVSFEFRGEMLHDGPCHLNFLNMEMPAYTQQSILPQHSANINSTSFNPYENELLKHIIPEQCDCNVQGVQYEHCGSNNIIERNPITFSTVSVPVDAVKSFIYSYGYKNEWKNPGFATSDIHISQRDAYYNSRYFDCNELSKGVNYVVEGKYYMKLMVDVIFEGVHLDGSPKEYTYLYTYEIDKNNISNLTGTTLSNNPQNYSQNINFEGYHFDGSFIPGCVLNGTTYTCSAIDNAYLVGDYTVAPGYEVFIEAGNTINVNNEASVSPEIVLQIVPLDVSNPMPVQESGNVNTFCLNKDRYRARSTKMAMFSNDSTTVYEEDVRDIFAFNIFPNPTSGSSAVSITLNESAKGELFITDMNGRTLATAFSAQTLRAGQTEHQLPTASLASGIYLVHLFVDGERHVKRLVKQ
jgi:hypothetical protein